MSKPKPKPKKPSKSKKPPKRPKSKSKAQARFSAPFNIGDRVILENFPEEPLPVRAELLNAARDLTLGDRNKQYGDPLTNFMAIVELKKAFWEAARRDSPSGLAHIEQNTVWGHAIDMLINNLGRIASAPTRDAAMAEDRYKDGINYLAIAYELAKRTIG